MAFWRGAHLCPGSSLARMVAQEMVGTLAQIPVGVLTAAEVRWERKVVTQGPTAVRVAPRP